jgi:ATP-binding cassette subfamily D (ALD) long-chain fatty acid import protein
LTALITISTRASLKRYHDYTLTLGMGDAGDEWEFQRIGTESEKSSVEKELAELRERLQKVEEWKKRRGEIEEELNRVWTQDEGELEAPEYLERSEEVGSGEEAVESGSDEVDRSEE